MIKRKQILVDRTFQHRLAVELMVIVIVVPAVLWLEFYILGQYALRNPPTPEDASGGLGLGALILQQWFLLLLLFLISFALIYPLVVYYTNRIAGPVYRFCRVLDGIAEGKLGERVKLRNRDYFENLGTSINRVSDSMRASIEELKSATRELREQASSLGNQALKDKIDALEQALAKFDTAVPRESEAESEAYAGSDVPAPQ